MPTSAGPHAALPSNMPSGIHGVLSVLEDMAAEAGGGGASVTDEFDWVGLDVVPWLARGPGLFTGPHLDADQAERFGAVDAIRPQSHSLRLGWGWVAGTTADADGAARRVFEPLTTMVIELHGQEVRRVGDLEVTPLVTRRELRDQLELEVRWGGDALRARRAQLSPEDLGTAEVQDVAHWLQRIAGAAGLHAAAISGVEGSPDEHGQRDGLHVVVGLGIFAERARTQFSPAEALALWQREIGTTWTALHTLYLEQAPPPPQRTPLNLPSAYELTETQHQAVEAVRTAPLTVIAGAPGTGKTHTIAAIVGDAVAHGRSVLVAAKAEATVEAILEVLSRKPGPEPVVFGSGLRRSELAQRLAGGEPTAEPSHVVDARWRDMNTAQQHRDGRWLQVRDGLLGLELLLGHGPGHHLREQLPGLATADLLTVGRALQTAPQTRPPWWRRTDRRSWDDTVAALGVTQMPPLPVRQQVVALATAARSLHQSADQLSDGIDWEGLREATDALERLTGRWMDAYARHETRLGSASRGVLGALARALRAGRAKRRAALAELAGQRVTTILPVWVGTLGDIDDLLPLQPATFDLVVLDEASSIDQPRAASALLRGASAVVVGDPQQLRHVSFVSNDATEQALQTHLPTASSSLRAKLDVRASSIFDVAASTAPVRVLDEHFRSAPHLFSFVGQRLYRGAVSLATRTPLTDREDRIALTRLEAERNPSKVVAEEVDWVMARLAELRAAGARSVGVVSPFRAQADAIEDTALRQLRREGIEALGLRVGTVHAFQGMERDIMLASIGVGASDGARTWQFVNDPHLFSVFATRGRERFEVVLSAEPPHDSLLADYLAQVDHPPPPPAGIDRACDPWTRSIAERVADTGLSVVAPYAAGRHQVDLVIHDQARCLAVETRLHPVGPDAHARRHIELVDAGWTVVAAHRARWDGGVAELALALRHRLDQMPANPPSRHI